jgi:malate permease and related proteins
MFIQLLPVLVAIFLGYIFNKTSFMSEDLFDGIKKIIINVCLPALLLSSLMRMKFKPDYWWVFVAMFLACALLLVIGYGIKGIFKIKSPYFPFLITGFEAGMLGYALYTSIYGSTADFAVIDVGQVLFVFAILVPMITLANNSEFDGGGSAKESVLTALKSPVLWAIILGVIISVVAKEKMYANEIFVAFESILRFIAAPTTFFICLVIGSGLKFSFKGMGQEILTCAIRLALCIGLAFLIKAVVLKPLGLAEQLSDALMFMFVLPGPFVIPAFMKNPELEDKNYVSNTLSIGTILSLVAISLIVLF